MELHLIQSSSLPAYCKLMVIDGPEPNLMTDIEISLLPYRSALIHDVDHYGKTGKARTAVLVLGRMNDLTQFNCHFFLNFETFSIRCAECPIN